MYAFKVVVTMLNVMFAILYLFFVRGYRWAEENDRPEIVGFGCMILLNIINSVLIWV